MKILEHKAKVFGQECKLELMHFDKNDGKEWKRIFDIWKELNWYSAKPANWRGLSCNILYSSTNMYMTHFDKKMKPYLYFEKTKATYFIIDWNYYFYMTSVGLQVNKTTLLNYTYYNNQEKKYYRFLVINADTLFNFIHSRKYNNFKVRIIDINFTDDDNLSQNKIKDLLESFESNKFHTALIEKLCSKWNAFSCDRAFIAGAKLSMHVIPLTI